MSCHQLVLVLGDQLDHASDAIARASVNDDRIIMIEARNESQRVQSHKARTAMFLAAMRHHAAALEQRGFAVDYVSIDRDEATDFATALQAAIQRHRPRRLVMVEAGEYSVQQEIDQTCRAQDLPLESLPDDHFLCRREAFADWRDGRRVLVMEHFYRFMRQQHDVLMHDAQPVGKQWNFDRQNRTPFGREGPGLMPRPPSFAPDRITRRVIEEVHQRFPKNPGSLDAFDWPVTRPQALDALADFVDHRLAAFGPFQDAMWDGEPYLHHSLLSAALNLHLLSPREVIDTAVTAYHDGRAPLPSVEGFVRQIIGWREYVRGVYWTEMPDYLDRNALRASRPLPGFYWTAETDMACLRRVIGRTLETGYAHHIQRLMVTGLFALLLGVRPREVHAWYLAMYVDAVEWVEVPNTLGMSQHADGGLLGTKPYAASGRYIQRMSNYCSQCRFAPDQSTGERACPFTTLYWDFLMRHEKRFARHPRAAMQWRNLDRLDQATKATIRRQAAALQDSLAG